MSFASRNNAHAYALCDAAGDHHPGHGRDLDNADGGARGSIDRDSSGGTANKRRTSRYRGSNTCIGRYRRPERSMPARKHP